MDPLILQLTSQLQLTTLGFSSAAILTQTKTASQLDLTEHAAIQTRKLSLNRTDCAPLQQAVRLLFPKIATSLQLHPAGITFSLPDDTRAPFLCKRLVEF